MPIPSLKLLLKVSLPVWLITPLFWIFPWDMQVASYWYDQGWPAGKAPIWQLFYHGVPVISALTLVGSLLLLIGSLWQQRLRPMRKVTSVLLLTILLGPGLMVNGIFKDHWGRPRPRQVELFGGERQYLPPFMPAFGERGKSLPCGHCSVPFVFYSFALLSNTPVGKLGWAITATVMGLGTGGARMAAGGHFFSDVLLSAWFSFFAAWLSVRWVSLPAAEKRWRALFCFNIHRNYVAAGGAGVVVLLGGCALLATPVDKQLHLNWSQTLPQQIHIDQGRVILLAAEQPGSAGLSLDVTGFGWPGSTVTSQESGGKLTLLNRGVFTDFDAKYQLRLPESLTLPLEIRVKNGQLQLPADGELSQFAFEFTEPGLLLVSPVVH